MEFKPDVEYLVAPLTEFKGHPDKAQQDEWDKEWIAAGNPIPPSHLLPEGSLLQAEAKRLEQEREKQQEDDSSSSK